MNSNPSARAEHEDVLSVLLQFLIQAEQVHPKSKRDIVDILDFCDIFSYRLRLMTKINFSDYLAKLDEASSKGEPKAVEILFFKLSGESIYEMLPIVRGEENTMPKEVWESDSVIIVDKVVPSANGGDGSDLVS